MSRAHTNSLGAQLAPCTYCGFCEKYGYGNYFKTSAQTTILPVLMRKSNFTLRTESEVIKINLDASGKRAVSVTYVDAAGQEFEQPADLILLTAYILHNVRLLLVPGIGKPYDTATGEGVVGKNYAHQITSSVNVFHDNKILNPFIGAGSMGMVIDDFNGDNFDHTGLRFLGGGYIATTQTSGRPIEQSITPEGTPKWGSIWKKAVAKNYL
ncbi:MAG: GMC family oxidoreductase N-terminal domain-containing protein [Burkholderiaceae bacterium]|nr:GMC family oxidoreductase N-terminal domain-containing protein [Burkholderiaceae bacterium]